MEPPPTIDDILFTLSEDDYIEYLSINLCGTIDDTSHGITYKKNRKNAGTLTVLDKTTPVDIRFNWEYEIIHGYKLIIDDMDCFNSVVMDFLRECSCHKVFSYDSNYGIWFELYVRFSNKRIIRAHINEPYIAEEAEKFYRYLSNYDSQLFEFKTIPNEVKELLKKGHYKERAVFKCKWNGYKVYCPDYSDEIDTDWGEPHFILYKDNKARWAIEEERYEIWRYNSKKYTKSVNDIEL